MVKISKSICNLSLLLILILILGNAAQAQFELFDPWEFSYEDYEKEDKDKSASELLQEALHLQSSSKYLEARTKLLLALKKEPKLLLAHLLLAEYYLRQVGHFKLALRYAKQAEHIMHEQYGNPPYYQLTIQETHKALLNLLSNIRLNLDDYEGALAALANFEKYHYQDSFLASSRAWILFKLGRNEEALAVARKALASNSREEKNAVLNILGILLSTTNQKEESLKVFKETLKMELALGVIGDPATPLNNAGEVYREIFDETNARKSWEQAVRTHDFCMHILLSVNLATLNIEELRFSDAKQNMLNFEKCIAQYPLKNEEEHKSLLKLILGRIALHTGDLNEAVNNLEDAVKEKQFFGKIGTNQDDMQVAAMTSLAEALEAKNYALKYHLNTSLKTAVQNFAKRSYNDLRIWWLKRRANQTSIRCINDFEDIYLRHTDSMIEYPLLGKILANIPTNLLKEKFTSIQDNRPLAKMYYDVFIAENLYNHGDENGAKILLKRAIPLLRTPHDDALKVEALALLLKILNPNSKQYAKIAYQLFNLSRSEILTHGIKLPINVNSSSKQLHSLLAKTIFLPTSTNNDVACKLNYNYAAKKHVLRFSCLPELKIIKEDLNEALNDLTLNIFKRKI